MNKRSKTKSLFELHCLTLRRTAPVFTHWSLCTGTEHVRKVAWHLSRLQRELCEIWRLKFENEKNNWGWGVWSVQTSGASSLLQTRTSSRVPTFSVEKQAAAMPGGTRIKHGGGLRVFPGEILSVQHFVIFMHHFQCSLLLSTWM